MVKNTPSYNNHVLTTVMTEVALKKITGFIIVFIFFISQNAFSDELLNYPSQKGRLSPLDSQKLSSSPSDFGQTSPHKSGSDLIGFGPDKIWQIRPGFEFKTAYDSNVNRAPQGQRKGDTILSYIPSIGIRRQGTHLAVFADYKMDFEEYLKNPRQNGWNHIIKSGVSFAGKRLKTNVTDDFSYIKAYASNEQSERRTIVINDVSPEIAYRLTPKFSIATVYDNRLFEYKESALRENSYDVNDIGGRIYYHMTPKLDFYVHGSGNTVDYFNSGLFDSKGYSILAGSKGQITNKIGVNVDTGFQSQYYDQSAIDAFHGWTYKGTINYRATSKLGVSLFGKRGREESVYRTVGYYTSTSGGLSLSYKVTSRMSIGVDGSIERNLYPSETLEGTTTKKRRDYAVVTGARFKWEPIRHVILSAGYSLRERDSNFGKIFDYIDHTIDASLSYKFS